MDNFIKYFYIKPYFVNWIRINYIPGLLDFKGYWLKRFFNILSVLYFLIYHVQRHMIS